MADDINLEVGADVDEAGTTRSANRMVDIFGQAFLRAAPEISRVFGEEIGRSFRRIRIGDDAFEPIVRSVENLTEQTRRADQTVGRIAEGFDRLGESGRRATRAINTDELNADMAALQKRVEATRRTLTSLGAEPDLFAVIDRELTKVLSTARAFNDNFERIARDPNLLQGYETSFRNAQQTIFREIGGIQSQLRNLSVVQRVEGDRVNDIAERQGRERLQEAKAAQSRFVVETQGANAQLLAETRLAGQRQIQQERIAARTRIELVRFTFRQIQILERGIAGVFRATGTVATNAARAVQAGTARIGNLFRRTNRDLNDGLGGALIARERTLDRSFSRQTASLNASLTRQTVLLDRFERQASTGIAGAVTGRSRLGGTLGLGAGIGGGFLLARQFREGFEETVNLNEALNKTEQVFGEASKSIVDFSENSVRALFLTQSQALGAAADFGVFGKAAGLEGENLATFSETLTRLATDLASFNNVSVDEAITALGSAIRGESEPISRLGVDTRQAALQQKALEIGLIDTARTLTSSERTLAAYAQILAKTTVQQGDAARTSEDFANSSKRAGAALTTAFGAAVSAVIPVAEAITNGALPALEGLTAFIEGESSPALLVFRDILIGVAVALTGLLAARVAAEAIQFLGLALRGAVTPLGLLIVGVAAAGAAIRVFSQRSERFSDIISAVVDRLGELGGQGVALARRGLSSLATILATRVIPAVEAVADIIVGPFVRGLEIAIGFIVNIAIPAMRRLGTIIASNIVPAFFAFGRFLTGTVIPALREFGGVALGVLGAVVRFLEPAAAGFRALGDAIVTAFQTGDLSGLLGGLQAVAVGIGTVFANLGVLIYEALRPQVERAVGFIGGAFAGIDYRGIGLRVLEVVRLVGFVLGSIVSDPRFIQALEAIALAAVAVGAKFVQGFAQGVISNLPGLASLLGGQFRTLIEAAVEFAFANPAVIGQVILAALAARAVRNAFRSAGAQGGREFIGGFGPAIRNNSRTTRGFFAGLFGGAGAIEQEATRAADRAAKAFRKRIDRANRDTNRLGGLGVTGLEATARGAREAERTLGKVKARFSDVGAEAILTGARTREAFRGAGVAAGGFGQILSRDVRAGFDNVRTGASTLRTAVVDQFRSFSSGGAAAGQALGGAVLAGFGSVIAGQQLGSGNTTIGLAGIISSGLAAGLATANVYIGVAVGAVGLLSAALSANKQAAEDAAREIGEYTEALKDARRFSEQVAGAAEVVFRNIREENAGTQDLLLSLGFNYAQFARDVVSDSFDIQDALGLVGPAFGEASGAFIDEVNRLVGEGAELGPAVALAAASFREFLPAGRTIYDVSEAVEALSDETSELRSGIASANQDRAFRELAGDTELANRGAEAFLQTLAVANGEVTVLGNSHPFVTVAQEVSEAAIATGEGLGGALNDVLDLLGDVDGYALDIDASGIIDTLLKIIGVANGGRSAVEAIAGGVAGGVGSVNTAIAVAKGGIAGFGDAAGDAFSYDQDLQELFDGIFGVGDAAGEAAEAVDLIGPAIQELNNQRTTRVRAEIEAIRNRLDDANEAAQRARESLTEFITARYASTAQSGVDSLIGNLGSIGSEIEDALRQGGVRGEAALRSAVGGFEGQLAGIIQAGFDDGLRTQEQFANLLAPLFAALDEEVGDSASRILSNTDFDFGITDRAGSSLREALERALAGRQVEVGASAIVNAEAEVARIEDLLNAQEAKLDVEVVFSAAQVQAALRAAGASPDQIAAADVAAVTAAQQTALVQAVAGAGAATANPIQPAPVIQVEQNNDITIPVSGATSPQATASAVVTAQGAAIAGRPVTIPRFTPV